MSPLALSAPRRSLLRRRNVLSSTLQAGFDGAASICVAWALISYHVGQLTLEYLLMLLLQLAILALSYDRMAVYRSNCSFTRKAFKLVQAWTLTFLILAFIGFISKQGEYFSRMLMLQFYLFGTASHLLLHFVFDAVQRTWLAERGGYSNALVIGEGDLANYLALKIRNNPWLRQRVVGALAVSDNPATESLQLETERLPVLGKVEDVRRVIESRDIRLAYIVTPLAGSKVLEDVYFALLDNNVSVHWIPDIFSLRLINHSIGELAGLPVLTLSETPLTGTRLLLKNLEDRVLSAALLVLASPFLLLIALAIRLDSPGPVFFRQERAGWNGRSFWIWKFRSMYVHQAEGGALKQAQKGDLRVTRVGALLRRTSLDELPQLLNVLLGDMSLVGPRPHAIQHDELYSRRITDYFARHHIKPGITGLAQVRGFRGETTEIDQMIQRVESDIEYINSWSIWLDLTILMRTTAAFTGKYAY